MNKMHIHSILLLLASWCLGTTLTWAQSVKAISVSNAQPYTDHVSLAEDSRDMDVMIKFIFDENKNVLTVSLLSYRRLFVFQEATRYSSVVCGNRLHPERLPYVAEAEKGARFTLSHALQKAIPRPRRHYVFNRWIACQGLQPVPVNYKMVNEFIEQAFNIQGKSTAVTVTLRDIFLLDSVEDKPDRYILSRGRDLNLTYQITIVRNPCLGKEDEIDATRKLCDEVKNAYRNLQQSYPGGAAPDSSSFKALTETRTILLTRYPVKDQEEKCPDLSKLILQYNQYVDSISQLNCRLAPPEDVSWDDGNPLDVKLVYTQTRQLDKAVARWLVSKDQLEKSDLITQCQDIIKDMSAMIRQHKVNTPEEQKAIQAYREAEQFFLNTCKK